MFKVVGLIHSIMPVHLDNYFTALASVAVIE